MSTNSGCLQAQGVYKKKVSTCSGCLQTGYFKIQGFLQNRKSVFPLRNCLFKHSDITHKFSCELQRTNEVAGRLCFYMCLSICSRGEVWTLHPGPYSQHLTPGTIAQLEPQKRKVRILLKCFLVWKLKMKEIDVQIIHSPISLPSDRSVHLQVGT